MALFSLFELPVLTLKIRHTFSFGLGVSTFLNQFLRVAGDAEKALTATLPDTIFF